MTAERELHNIYAEWRRLAEAEGEAIRASNWEFVADCQRALAQLRPTIDSLTERVRKEPAPPISNDIARAGTFRSTVLELIELERRNLAWLQQRRQNLSTHVEQLSRSSRNLRGIQRSYAPPIPAAWTSYS